MLHGGIEYLCTGTVVVTRRAVFGYKRESYTDSMHRYRYQVVESNRLWGFILNFFDPDAS